MYASFFVSFAFFVAACKGSVEQGAALKENSISDDAVEGVLSNERYTKTLYTVCGERERKADDPDSRVVVVIPGGVRIPAFLGEVRHSNPPNALVCLDGKIQSLRWRWARNREDLAQSDLDPPLGKFFMGTDPEQTGNAQVLEVSVKRRSANINNIIVTAQYIRDRAGDQEAFLPHDFNTNFATDGRDSYCVDIIAAADKTQTEHRHIDTFRDIHSPTDDPAALFQYLNCRAP